MQQSKLANSSDWPTLGSEAAAISNANKKEISNATSNGDLREKDKKPLVNSKPRSENSDAPQPPKEATEAAGDLANDVQPTAAVVASTKAHSPVPDANATNEVKNVPKAIDDGAKKVNTKPKWNRFDVETKSSSSTTASQNRRKSDRSPPRRNNRDDRDYYSRRDDRVRDDDRSIRRGNSNRGSVPSSSTRNPRGGVATVPVAPAAAVAVTAAPASTSGSIKSTAPRGPRREPAYITRSNRPSYTESKTPGLNGNPVVIKSSDHYDAKKQKPLLGRPIIIDAISPIVTAHNIYGTYYFNGPTPFSLDAIGNIKESIKKQM